jgi:signal transduction histidine kinase
LKKKKLPKAYKMQNLKQRIYDDFNLKKEADELGVKVWQSPSFLFIVMGVIIIAAMTGIYFVSKNYDSPEVVVLAECGVVAILFTMGNFIIRVVEEIAKANKMKSEFVSIASHQLKTPLAEMNWQIELLLSKFQAGMNEKQGELVKGILHSSVKMGRLVNDLLDVARIDQGQLALNKETINFCALVHNVTQSQQEFAKTRSVELRDSCPIVPVEIFMDKRRVAIAFENLLSNGLKYTKSGGVVEVFMEEKDGFVQVCVRDNGVGIPKTEQAEIAKKFFRSDSIKDETDGTGLGLYITKNIVEQSGGKFWFQSEENVGSEFYITLPIAKNI